MQPRLITSPINVTAKENETAYFHCDFTASTLEYLTITEWYKDSIKLNNTNKFRITKKLHKSNEIHLTLNISSISRNDKGTYRCHCYYNTTTLYQLGIYKNYSSQGLAMLEIEGIYAYVVTPILSHMYSLFKHFIGAINSNNSDDLGLIIGLSLPVVAVIVVGILILLYYKKKSQGKYVHMDNTYV